MQMCETTGQLWLGGYDSSFITSPFIFTPIIVPMYYNVLMSSFHFNGEPIGDFHVIDFGQVLVDSGTTRLLLPKAVYDALLERLVRNQHFVNAFGMHYFEQDYCIQSKNGLSKEELNALLPTISVVLGQGSDAIVLEMEAISSYLNRYVTDTGVVTYCPGIGVSPSLFVMKTTILGYSFMNQFTILFDRENHKIGFSRTKGCPEVVRGERNIERKNRIPQLVMLNNKPIRENLDNGLPSNDLISGFGSSSSSSPSSSAVTLYEHRSLPRWAVSRHFSKCTAVCGGGLQHRSIYCLDSNDQIVDEKLCLDSINVIGKRPTQEQSCNVHACVGPKRRVSKVSVDVKTVNITQSITISWETESSIPDQPIKSVVLFLFASKPSISPVYLSRSTPNTGELEVEIKKEWNLKPGQYRVAVGTSVGNYKLGPAVTVKECDDECKKEGSQKKEKEGSGRSGTNQLAPVMVTSDPLFAVLSVPYSSIETAPIRNAFLALFSDDIAFLVQSLYPASSSSSVSVPIQKLAPQPGSLDHFASAGASFPAGGKPQSLISSAVSSSSASSHTMIQFTVCIPSSSFSSSPPPNSSVLASDVSSRISSLLLTLFDHPASSSSSPYDSLIPDDLLIGETIPYILDLASLASEKEVEAYLTREVKEYSKMEEEERTIKRAGVDKQDGDLMADVTSTEDMIQVANQQTQLELADSVDKHADQTHEDIIDEILSPSHFYVYIFLSIAFVFMLIVGILFFDWNRMRQRMKRLEGDLVKSGAKKKYQLESVMTDEVQVEMKM